MSAKFTGLGIPSQPPLLQYGGNYASDGVWLLWLSYNKGVPTGASGAGTYLLLHPDGKIERHTTDDEGAITQVVTIKPKEV